MKLSPKHLGLAGGIFWGLVMLITTLLAVWNGYGTAMMELFTSIYPGFTISGTGAIVGLIYGFIDGFVGLYIFAWLYNWLQKKC